MPDTELISGDRKGSASSRLSLEVKLPLLMSLVLAAVVATLYVVTYSAVRRGAYARAADRLDRATRQLASVGAASIATQHARFLPVASDTAIRRALETRVALPAVSRALERLVLPTDSGLPVELWTADGRRVAWVGRDVRASGAATWGRPELPIPVKPEVTTAAGDRADSLRLGPLYREAERVHFWFVMPVRDQGRTLGYITQQRTLAVSAATARTIRELSGDSVSIYYRNADRSFWTTLSGVTFGGLRDANTGDGTVLDSAGSRLLAREQRIGTTPIVMGMVMPESVVYSTAARTLRIALLVGIALLLLGVLAAWLVGRSVSRPLVRLTRAAEALAEGNFDTRVATTGDLEIRQLADSFNRMAGQIGASRAALERQTREAQAASSAKSEFLTMMSHELRTPLNAIGGYVDLLDMGLRGPVTDSQKRDLARIKASQEHLLGLISGVLDLARIEAGRVTYAMESVSVDSFLASLDALVAPQAAAKQIRLEHHRASEDLVVSADREKLRQILLNLLSNAIRHTPSGGEVRLSAEGRGGRIAIMVEDTGPGIPRERQQAVFEPFVQLDRSLTQSVEGIGLGLAISRDLARGMSGDLAVDPVHTGGARFVLTLNRGAADAPLVMHSTGETTAIPT